MENSTAFAVLRSYDRNSVCYGFILGDVWASALILHPIQRAVNERLPEGISLCEWRKVAGRPPVHFTVPEHPLAHRREVRGFQVSFNF
jgi:hypothetical protein